MLSKDLEVTLNMAFKGARSKRHEFMTVEHLLLALIDNESAASVLRACGTDLNVLRKDLRTIRNVKHSRRWASSVCCSGRYFTCSPPVKRR